MFTSWLLAVNVTNKRASWQSVLCPSYTSTGFGDIRRNDILRNLAGPKRPSPNSAWGGGPPVVPFGAPRPMPWHMPRATIATLSWPTDAMTVANAMAVSQCCQCAMGLRLKYYQLSKPHKTHDKT